MEKLDLSKKYRSYFSAKQKPELLDIGPALFLSIRGKGDPSDFAFMEKIQALYATSYGVKFMFKAQGKDFIVSKLEGLWWFDQNKFDVQSIDEASQKVPRKEWEYRLLIRMPEYVTKQEVFASIQHVVLHKKIKIAEEITLFEMTEGLCVQMMHIGPFSTEPESLVQIGAFMKENNLSRNGLHHEIYLSDFRKTDPLRLKTILREPVK